MRFYSTLFFCVIVGSSIWSQSLDRFIIGTGNGNGSDTNVDLTWSVGESFINYNETEFGLLTEGFIQPMVLKSYRLQLEIPFKMEAFPSPSADYVQLKLDQVTQEKLLIRLVEASGRLINSTYIPRGDLSLKVDMTSVPSGLYWIVVSSADHKIYQTITISKIF